MRSRPSTVKGLYDAVKKAKPGTTIFLADGVYKLPSEQLVIRTHKIALRGESGDREKVILDRGRRGRQSCVAVNGAHDVLIADLTVRNTMTHGIHVQPHVEPDGTQRTRIYNVKFHNFAVRGLKGSHPKLHHEPVGKDREELLRKRPTGGEVRYCLFLNDKRKSNAKDGFNGDYVGGIDMMWLKDWVIADNVFIGIRGLNGVGRGAIFIWQHCEDVVAERNIIMNCDRGICFGNPSGPPLHMTRGIVRNNFILVGTSQGIELVRTVNTQVVHNTIVAHSPAHPAAVQFHQGSKGAKFANNIVHGQVRRDKGVTGGGNIIGACDDLLADPSRGDMHLRPEADVDKVKAVKAASEDFDRKRRPAMTTPGAAGRGK